MTDGKKLSGQPNPLSGVGNGGAEKEKISPFIYYEGMSYRKIKKRDSSGFEIQRMLINGTLTECHDRVMRIMGQYGYLNSYLLRTHLAHISGGKHDYDGSHMRRVLKGMVQTGLLIQYELLHMEAGEICGSPFLYALSNGGVRYLKRMGMHGVHPFLKIPFDIVKVLELVSYNQFHIMFLRQHGFSPAYMHDEYFGGCYQAFGVPNLYILKLPAGSRLCLYAISVRGGEGWTKKYLSQLRAVCRYLGENHILDAAVLAVCETEAQAMQCARKKGCEADLKALVVFYVTDTAVMEEDDVFGRLIDVRSEGDYCRRQTVRLQLRGEGMGE